MQNLKNKRKTLVTEKIKLIKKKHILETLMQNFRL